MTANIKQVARALSQPAFVVILIAAGIRLYACLTTYVVNPDGIHYIYQAKSIFYNDLASLTACHIKYVSLLPFLIAAAYGIVHDWIAAGRLVSFCFGLAALLPLYLLLRRFFEKPLAAAVLLAYALMPLFVSRSADILRDPLFWFFSCSGMLVFMRQWDKSSQGRFALSLTAACTLFLLAMWTRIEGVVFIAGSGFYLLLCRTDHRAKKLFFFAIPLLCMGLALLAGLLAFDERVFRFVRLDKLRLEATQFYDHYEAVRSQLATLAPEYSGYFRQFLHRVHEVLWYLPFALIAKSVLQGFYYPYAALFVLGFIGISRRWSGTRGTGYFVCLSVFSIGVIYIHLLQSWLIQNRFVATLILPGCLFMGFGIDNALRFLRQKCGLRPVIATGFVLLFILGFGLGKNLRPHHKDKVVFRQIGELIADRKEHGQIARISAAHSTVYEWVFFYAHRDYPGALCARKLIGDIPGRYGQLVEDMARAGIHYLLYEENEWPKNAFDLMAEPFDREFRVVGTWHHKDTGTLMLLELRKNQATNSSSSLSKMTSSSTWREWALN